MGGDRPSDLPQGGSHALCLHDGYRHDDGSIKFGDDTDDDEDRHEDRVRRSSNIVSTAINIINYSVDHGSDDRTAIH
jgi:hypothetical protein